MAMSRRVLFVGGCVYPRFLHCVVASAVFSLEAVVRLGVYCKLDCRSDMHGILLLDIYISISLLLKGQCAVNCVSATLL